MSLRSILAGLLAVAQVPELSPSAEDAAITWRTPMSCPTRGALLQGIEARLGRPLRAGELAIDGLVTAHASPPLYRLRLRLRVGGPEESRTLTAATCAALADATAVLAVTAIKTRAPGAVPTAPEPTGAAPPRRRESPGPEPAGTTVVGAAPPAGPGDALPTGPEGVGVPEVAVVAPQEDAPTGGLGPVDEPVSAPWTGVVPEPEAVAASPPTVQRPRAPGGFVRVQGGPEVGALPGVTGAVGLATGLLWRRARLELHGVYLAPRTAVTARGELRASLAAAAMLGCGRPGRGRVEVPLCGGLELGGMSAAARGVPDARTTAGLWLAMMAGAGISVRLSERWSVWGALQLVTPLVQLNFEVRDPGPREPLFAPRPVTGRLLLGVELHFRDPR